MVAFDAEVLRNDPARIALGGASESLLAEAADAPQPESPACQAALAHQRTALMFQVLFTSLVLVVAVASAAALVYAIIRITKDGLELSAVVTGVSGVVGSGGTAFLAKRMSESIKVAQAALGDVGKYCGGEIEEQLKRS